MGKIQGKKYLLEGNSKDKVVLFISGISGKVFEYDMYNDFAKACVEFGVSILRVSYWKDEKDIFYNLYICSFVFRHI